jgi:YD repeat-containing protein
MTRRSRTIVLGAALLPLLLCGALTGRALAQGSDVTILLGNWVRPDGGYTITIRGVDTSGKLQASYANPTPLPFSKAEVSRDGKTIKLFFELRAAGYNGSTYRLTYDAAADRLVGVYFQAVQRTEFEVFFQRAK